MGTAGPFAPRTGCCRRQSSTVGYRRRWGEEEEEKKEGSSSWFVLVVLGTGVVLVRCLAPGVSFRGINRLIEVEGKLLT